MIMTLIQLHFLAELYTIIGIIYATIQINISRSLKAKDKCFYESWVFHSP